MSEPIDIFTRLGGTRAMARVLDEAPSTVQSWKAAGRIPAHKQPLLIERYAALGIIVTAEEVVFPFGQMPSTPSETAAA